MRSRYLLEISVESVERAIAAERGGADRIELCSNLAVAGLTPSAELMRAVRKGVTLPVFAMVRPRAGDFLYAKSEFEQMKHHIALVRECRMDGVVVGLLHEDGGVDIARTCELVQLAKPLPVTFHRAFDESVDLGRALEDVIAAGCTRILTSGGAATAFEGRHKIAGLVQRAGERVVILPGGGVTATNATEIAHATRAREFHAALSSLAAVDASTDTFERGVDRLAAALLQAETS